MLQITLHLTRSSRLWTLLLLGLELCISTRHFNRFYGDTHRRDFIIYVYHTIFDKISLAEVKEYYKKIVPIWTAYISFISQGRNRRFIRDNYYVIM
jgi:hypothetical protein